MMIDDEDALMECAMLLRHFKRWRNIANVLMAEKQKKKKKTEKYTSKILQEN